MSFASKPGDVPRNARHILTDQTTFQQSAGPGNPDFCSVCIVHADDVAGVVDRDAAGNVVYASAAPLAVFDPDPKNLWNRMFSTLYLRPRHFPATDRKPDTIRYEGGDVIEFLAWGKTEYWSSGSLFAKLDP